MRTKSVRVLKSFWVRSGAPLLVSLALFASVTPNAAQAAAATTMTPLKVALVAPSAVNDLAFTESMVWALQQLKTQYNLEISISDNQFVVSDAANLIREYAAHGYNLVIAHGSQYGSILQQLAPKFPKVSFAWGTAGSTFGERNIWAYQANSNEGGYVQGYMAGMLSKSHIIGIIGPIDVGDAQLYVDGFKAGVLAQDPKATVHVSFTGSFSDVTLMASAAKSYVADGADVLTGSSQSVVGAIGVAKAHNVAWFGTQWTQASLAPSDVVSSQIYNWEPVLKQILSGVKAGKLGGGTFTITLGNGGERVAFNPGYPLPANVKAQAEKLVSLISEGKLSVPR
ncbi:MAG TPA: BMP family protein [Acidimicrobiales bacterium]|nr:BMP family protein [Acidimicrobiales bacterium]